MSNSSLVNYTKLVKNYSKMTGKVNRKITIHHMAGNLSVETCANVFNGDREASANYGIGSDGRIGLYVEESNRAWTSSNKDNDSQAVTIEVANNTLAPNWTVSDKAMTSLINLCVDICQRNGIKALNYTGDKNGNLTLHKMFASTICPGPYLESKIPYIVSKVNARLNSTPKPVARPTSSNASASGSFRVKVTADALNIRAGAGTNYKIVGMIRDRGVYTIVQTSGNWGKLKSGAGWICLDYTSTPKEDPKPTTSGAPNKSPKWVGKVTADALNVRSWAGTENPNIKSYPMLYRDNLVDVCDTVKAKDGGSWYYVRIAGKIYGFVSAKYIARA